MSVWSLNKIWLTNTPNRSEYSPQFTPDGQELSYITLSPEGIQDFRSGQIRRRDTGRLAHPGLLTC